VNHNGSLDLALRLVDEAAAAGADAVKFQSFNPAALASADAGKADYQSKHTGAGSQLEMLTGLQLDEAAHVALLDRCRAKGIAFLSAPFDLPSVELLSSLGIREFKIASGEITDLPVLRAVARRADTILMSTGMATLAEIAAALDALEEAGAARDRITLLHCTTEYPAPFDEVNLRAMAELRETFGLEVGYSDHTQGIEVSIAAVALGAVVIEKHFTLDRSMPGPDHAASLEPAELAELVSSARNVALALGEARKTPGAAELRNIPIVRKSIVASRRIEAGEVLTEDNVVAKRPGTGLSPMLWDSVIGTVASRPFDKDELIEL